MTTEFNLYKELVEAGVEIDNHESDLYFPKTDASVEVIRRCPLEIKQNITTFRDKETNAIWACAPFAYDPWWERAEKIVEGWCQKLEGECV